MSHTRENTTYKLFMALRFALIFLFYFIFAVNKNNKNSSSCSSFFFDFIIIITTTIDMEIFRNDIESKSPIGPPRSGTTLQRSATLPANPKLAKSRVPFRVRSPSTDQVRRPFSSLRVSGIS